MARKIKINSNLLDAQSDYKKNNQKKINIILIIIVGILTVSLIGGFIYFNSKLSNANDEIDDLKSENSRVYSRLYSITGFNTVDYIKDKLNFLDENVVFQIKGYGNYYYTYDCMIEKTVGKEYSFWAYNLAAAKGNGLKKGNC